jgi:hypothetical protein
METTPKPPHRIRRAPVAAVGALALVALAWTSPSRASAPAGRYTATAGQVTDARTGLTWQQTASSSNGGDAAAYCAALDLNGTGWRLPTIKELLTIVDDTRAKPAIDPIFACGPNEVDISSTVLARLAQYGSAYYMVLFSDGHSMYGNGPGTSTRCVRAAAAP